MTPCLGFCNFKQEAIKLAKSLTFDQFAKIESLENNAHTVKHFGGEPSQAIKS